MDKLLKILPLLLFIALPITPLFSYQISDSLKSSSSNSIYVGEIIIAGNETTNEVVIRREMQTKEGEILNVDIFRRDIEKINNLGLFTKVEVIPIPVSADTVNFVINVEETFYILPVPQGGLRDGELKKIWGGLNIKWRNFRGMNESLGLSFGLGYEPFVRASYSNPWLGSDKYFFSTGGGYAQKYIQDLYNLPPGTIVDMDTLPKYSTESVNANFSFGRFIDRNLSISVGGGYNRTIVNDYRPGRSLSPTGVDDYPSAFINSHLDSRDLFSYPSNGAYGNLDIIQYGFSNDYINFNRVSLDFRKYIPIIPLDDYTIIFASRVVNSITWGGNVPPYLKEKFGYGNEIRGWNSKVFEGDNLLGVSAELRFPIIKPAFIEGKKLPVIKKISLLKDISYKYGLYVTLFYDAGGVWDKQDNFFKTQFRSGYGIGLNAILPFNAIGRMDVAFSRQMTNKFHVEVKFDLSSSF